MRPMTRPSGGQAVRTYVGEMQTRAAASGDGDASGESWAWQLNAACRGLPASIFYPSDGERGSRRLRRELYAKRICAECPVIADCLRHAINWPETHGIWGATTPPERTNRIVRDHIRR